MKEIYLTIIVIALTTFNFSCTATRIIKGVDTIREVAPLLKLPAKKGEVTMQAAPQSTDSTFSYKVYPKTQSFPMVRAQILAGAEDWDVASGSVTVKVKKGEALYAFYDDSDMDLNTSWSGSKKDCSEKGGTCLLQLEITADIME